MSDSDDFQFKKKKRSVNLKTTQSESQNHFSTNLSRNNDDNNSSYKQGNRDNFLQNRGGDGKRSERRSISRDRDGDKGKNKYKDDYPFSHKRDFSSRDQRSRSRDRYRENDRDRSEDKDRYRDRYRDTRYTDKNNYKERNNDRYFNRDDSRDRLRDTNRHHHNNSDRRRYDERDSYQSKGRNPYNNTYQTDRKENSVKNPFSGGYDNKNSNNERDHRGDDFKSEPKVLKGRYASNRHIPQNSNPDELPLKHEDKEGVEGRKFKNVGEKARTLRYESRGKHIQAYENDLLRRGTDGVRDIDIDRVGGEEDRDEFDLTTTDSKPLFLRHSKFGVDSETETISLFKDRHGDFATCCKEGSDTLRSYRQDLERQKNQDKFWEAGGNTAMGQAMGRPVKKESLEDDDDNDCLGYSAAFAVNNNSAASQIDPSNSMLESRESLPVHSVRTEFLSLLREHQILVVVGETGSGKSTQLAQYLYEEGFARDGVIACTQPRRVATVSVANRVCEEVRMSYLEKGGVIPPNFSSGDHPMNTGSTEGPKRGRGASKDDRAEGVTSLMNQYDIGGVVGYSIRFEEYSSVHTKIKFLTDGMLLRECLNTIDADSDSSNRSETNKNNLKGDRENRGHEESDLEQALQLSTSTVKTGIDKYSVVILDEAHERTLSTDTLLGILRKLASSSPKLKIIVTSATMDANKFSQYFGNAPVFHIPGRTYPVEIRWSKSFKADYIKAMVDEIIKLHLSEGPGDILAFTAGQEDIEAICALVCAKMYEMESEAQREHQIKMEAKAAESGKLMPSSSNDDGNNDPYGDHGPFYPILQIHPLYSQLTASSQSEIFIPSVNRKCIVSTNVAETSITLNKVKYVVDSGLCKVKMYNANAGMEVLQLCPISQANASQRSGRAGRVGPGVCVRLYTDRMFVNEMYKMPIPEIQRSQLMNTLLLLLNLQIDPLSFDFLDTPLRSYIEQGLYNLWCLGCVDEHGVLTPTGVHMGRFPLDPALSRMLIESSRRKCVFECVVIAAMLSVNNIFLSSNVNVTAKKSDTTGASGNVDGSSSHKELIELQHSKLMIHNSDHLTMLNVFLQWQTRKYSKHFCEEYFLNFSNLVKVRRILTQLVSTCQATNMTISSSSSASLTGDTCDRVKLCVLTGYLVNIGKMKNINTYTHLITQREVFLPNLSAITDNAQYVVFQQVLVTTKQFMRVVSVIDPGWILAVGHHLYTTRKEKSLMLRAGESKLDSFIQTVLDSEGQMERKTIEEREIQKQKEMFEQTQSIGFGARKVNRPKYRPFNNI